MRCRKFISKEVTDIDFVYSINGINDVFNTKRFPFSEFKELTGEVDERAAQQKAKNIFKDFLKLVADDIILENNIFILPVRGMGYIMIKRCENLDRDDYVYQFHSDGKIFTSRFKINDEYRERTKKIFKFRFNQVNRNRMADLIINGHKY